MKSNQSEIHNLINQLLGGYWTALAQHRTHVGLLRAWSLEGLATSMEARIADEPVTIKILQDRLQDLDGLPDFEIKSPRIGKTLKDVLTFDLEIQRSARPFLNKAAETAAGVHDATTRNIFENILKDEEEHLTWLESEVGLYEKIGEQLYIANRLR